MKPALTRLLFSLSLLPIPVVTAGNHDHHHHDAHIHGEARLQMVMEHDALEMELQTPAQDIVGFEHAAAHDEERQQVADAIARLEAGNKLFRFEGTACALQEAKAEQHTSKGGHVEFHSHYRFRCEQPDELRHIDVQLANRFNGITRIHAQWIFGSHQGTRTLNSDNHRIEVK